MKNQVPGQKSNLTKHNTILLTGSTADKYPVMMDDRKTIIFISDKSKEEETRQRYSSYGQNINAK
jgi:hypothetical protein